MTTKSRHGTHEAQLADLIELLQQLTPGEPGDDGLGELRKNIDRIDQIILQLVNRRVEYAAVIGKLKKSAGTPVYVPTREAEVLENVHRGNRGPLSEEAVRRVFERIIDETRSLERRRYQDDPLTRVDSERVDSQQLRQDED